MSRILAAMLSLALALTPFVSCSDANVAPSRATADALADWVVIPRGDGPIDDDAPAPPPAYNADGWLRLDLAPYNDCGLYAAPSKDKLPPPIRWEPCDPIFAASGLLAARLLPTLGRRSTS